MKSMKKNVYITKPLCYTVEINIVNQLYFNKIKILSHSSEILFKEYDFKILIYL